MTITRTESATRPAASRTTLPAPKYPRVFGAGRGRLLQYGDFIFLALFVLAPIVPILYQSFRDRPLYEVGGLLTADNYVRLFTDAGFGQVIWNTAVFAIGT